MTKPLAAWICAATLAMVMHGACAQEPGERIAESARNTMDAAELPAVPGAFYELELTLATFLQGHWDAKAMFAAARQAAEILAQCGVRTVSVQLRIIDAPRHYRFYFTPVSRRLARTLPLPRPTAYFADDTLNQPAFDAEAIGRGNSRTRPELEGTVWLTHGVREPGVALAHELAHVLMDSGEHSAQAGNLMRTETSATNIHLDAMQCARLTTVGAQQGLLKPLPR
ncbi:MAG: hypothetical protein WCR74_02975 [Betaproteobacteria bacterium]